MKVIIAGSRTILEKEVVNRVIFNGIYKLVKSEDIAKGNLEIVSGTALGVDRIGEDWAKSFNYKVTRFPANWEKYGKKAGFMRNREMANYADALIAIWDGKSKGTKMMIDIAKKKGLKVFVNELT